MLEGNQLEYYGSNDIARRLDEYNHFVLSAFAGLNGIDFLFKNKKELIDFFIKRNIDFERLNQYCGNILISESELIFLENKEFEILAYKKVLESFSLLQKSNIPALENNAEFLARRDYFSEKVTDGYKMIIYVDLVNMIQSVDMKKHICGNLKFKISSIKKSFEKIISLYHKNAENKMLFNQIFQIEYDLSMRKPGIDSLISIYLDSDSNNYLIERFYKKFKDKVYNNNRKNSGEKKQMTLWLKKDVKDKILEISSQKGISSSCLIDKIFEDANIRKLINNL